MPYHSLAEAHRLLAREFGLGSTYRAASYPGMFKLISRIAVSTMTRAKASNPSNYTKIGEIA